METDIEIATNERAIVITGGPGMGKTSIINQLRRMGYACIPESGRDIIRHQLETKGNKLPWADRQGYAWEMFQTAIHDYKQVLEKNANTFFDRGLPDVIGYLTLCKLPIPDEMWLAAKQYRYHRVVFITPPWQEIYVNDSERKQSFEEAIATYEVMHRIYLDLDYTLTEIPKAPLEERAHFVVDSVATKPLSQPPTA